VPELGRDTPVPELGRDTPVPELGGTHQCLNSYECLAPRDSLLVTLTVHEPHCGHASWSACAGVRMSAVKHRFVHANSRMGIGYVVVLVPIMC